MKKLTQIVLVGHTPQRLIEGIKQYPMDKIILILGDNLELEGERKVYETANLVETAFKDLVTVEKSFINKEDILASTQKVLNLIKQEAKNGYDILLNISGSLRQTAIACYMAALVSKSSLYSVLPKYDENYNEIGVKRVYTIPLFPIKELSDMELTILKIVRKYEVIESIESLIHKMYPAISNDELNKFRAKISYYLRNLEEENFIIKKRAGKKVNIELLLLGKIYVLGEEIIDLKK